MGIDLGEQSLQFRRRDLRAAPNGGAQSLREVHGGQYVITGECVYGTRAGLSGLRCCLGVCATSSQVVG